MKLKFNRDTKLEVVRIGIFEPNEFIITDDVSGEMMLKTGYFDEIKEKEIKIKIKKSKKKGVD